MTSVTILRIYSLIFAQKLKLIEMSFFGLFGGVKYQTLNGYLILPEVRQTVLAIVGFYFGSSTIK